MSLPTNLLGQEASPYLRQHARNPVHWRAWSRAALDEAQALGRPILLSIGYAACHWCHVMAHESFENPAIAEVMNRLFVNIKVDREERPDIDQIYMAALSSMGEQGGWPLTMFLTPQGQPFWGGTYFPPTARYGRPGFVQVLESIADAWRTKRQSLAESAAALVTHVEAQLASDASPSAVAPGALQDVASRIHALIDPEKGGIRGAPKFPNMPMMQTLWLSWRKDGADEHRDAVLASLRAMLAGGIYDHVGGGLCRYSTDADWLVPHFEKMLYDNAQLLRLCNWAYAETSDDLFRVRIEETVGWLLREMQSPAGGFASSLDADSEGQEGLFYTWTEDEITEALGGDMTWPSFLTLAGPAAWEGKPVLCQTAAQQRHEAAHIPQASALKARLLKSRDGRVRPERDDKVLSDWNGMVIAAMTECGRALARADWIEAAAAVFWSIASSAVDGRLPHSTLGRSRQFPALSSDYAAMANAAIALFEATSEPRYVVKALEFVDQLERWHADATATGYYLSAADASDVPIRSRGDVDDATPSATAQVIEALVRTALAAGDVALQEKALIVAEHASGRAAHQAYGQVGIINACAMAIAPKKLVIVETSPPPRLVPVANRYPDPLRVDIIVGPGDEPASLADGSVPRTDRPGAYLCVGPVCLPPIESPQELDRALRRFGTESTSA